MISPLGVFKAGMLFGGTIVIRAIARARVERRQRQALQSPLVDPVLLETTFVPASGEDPTLVAEVRDTIAHLNRQAWAEEFYALPTQLVQLDQRVPKAARSTLRGLMGRLIHSEDRWLVIIGARTLSRLDRDAAQREIDVAIDRLKQLPAHSAADTSLLAELGTIRAGDKEAVSM